MVIVPPTLRRDKLRRCTPFCGLGTRSWRASSALDAVRSVDLVTRLVESTSRTGASPLTGASEAPAPEANFHADAGVSIDPQDRNSDLL
jgi:hypothetical protein